MGETISDLSSRIDSTISTTRAKYDKIEEKLLVVMEDVVDVSKVSGTTTVGRS
jgi:hypothetical protein